MLADELILKSLFRKLWEAYVERVDYAREYQRLVLEKGGQVRNDHIAFRTIRVDSYEYPFGIFGIGRIFETLGYRPQNEYLFEDKHLHAVHYEHPCEDLPLIFISELLVDELPEDIQSIIKNRVESSSKDRVNPRLFDDTFDRLAHQDEIVDNLFNFFNKQPRPWGLPSAEEIFAVDNVSQYGAWTLIHGNSVNHFTAYVNKQGVEEWPDIEATVAGLIEGGVPMRPEIEGDPGSKLRQTATQPVIEKTFLGENTTARGVVAVDWPYAYYEIAERGLDDLGDKQFRGFLGPQATQLFEMTKKSK